MSCATKQVADLMESLIGAVFLSTNLRKTLEFLSQINLVPLKPEALSGIPDEDLTFRLAPDLERYGYSINDPVSELFAKFISASNPSNPMFHKMLYLIE
mmetsp:Transcript_6224/g.10131  ORF Transcript_6224/g.10131 Transcript_6224/m.10131 type:complete len:99 (-) Transcript_6224:1162-1458(-)